ncbi:Homeobox-leucine zipper protein ATHB-15 [Asimina triloba]
MVIRGVFGWREDQSLLSGYCDFYLDGMMAVTSCKDLKAGLDPGKYVRYTPEQVEALERLYHECPKPSSVRRQQLIRECPILSNIEPKQIKVWFQNRRCREKQRKEALRLQAVNRKLTAMNKLLMEENDRLQKQVSQLVYENGYYRQQNQNVTGFAANTALATTDTSCESVVTSGQHHLTPQHPPRDASPAGLLSIAEETLTEFLSKATGTAVEWVQMPGMKKAETGGMLYSRYSSGLYLIAGRHLGTRLHGSSITVLEYGGGVLLSGFENSVLSNQVGGLLESVAVQVAVCSVDDLVLCFRLEPGPDSIGIVAISHGCPGIAARACGLVGLEPTRVAEILKDRPSWFRDCRSVDVINVLPTGNSGTIELLYMQLYAPTTLAPARDFWLLRYTSVLEDGSLVVCERSLSSTQGGPSMPAVQHFVRAEMLPSGYLIRPCEGGGSIIHIVDHLDLEVHLLLTWVVFTFFQDIDEYSASENFLMDDAIAAYQPWSVPEVIRPLYESSTVLSQKMTMAALRQLRQIAQDASPSTVTGWGRRPAALRVLSQRLSRGFNEAVNGFTDEGWSVMANDGMDDITILVNSSPGKMVSVNLAFANGFPAMNNAVLCAKASMLLQNVPPAVLLRFLREHRSEWADSNIDAYSASAVKAVPCGLPGSRVGGFGGQIILPLAHTIEHEEFLEVIRLENISHNHEDTMMSRDTFLLQLCNGMDENAIGTCAELIFAPIDASLADDPPLLPSGFRIIPLDNGLLEDPLIDVKFICITYRLLILVTRKPSLQDASSPNRTLDLASTLEVGSSGSRPSGGFSGARGSMRSVMTIAFQFAFESHLQESVATMARQYVRSIISSVQRVALALSPSRLGSHGGLRPPPGTPEALTLARWICHSYRKMARRHLGDELLKQGTEGSESLLKTLWHHSDAIMCCSLKALPVFNFANQAGLDMLETTLVALQDITLEKIFDDHGRKTLYTEFPQIMQQGFACLQGGICVSSMGRPISYERAVAWKVLNEEDTAHCIAFMFINWSFV